MTGDDVTRQFDGDPTDPNFGWAVTAYWSGPKDPPPTREQVLAAFPEIRLHEPVWEEQDATWLTTLPANWVTKLENGESIHHHRNGLVIEIEVDR